MATKTHKFRPWLVTAAVVAGASLGSAGLASAATSSSHSTSTSATSSQASASTNQGTASQSTNNQMVNGQSPTAAPDPAAMSHGPGETLLTGDDLSKAVAAAMATQSGATVIRAETDSSGKGTYEVHMKKADGSDITVYLDGSFNVTGSENGFGAGPKGSVSPQNPPAPQSQGSTSTN